MRNVYLVTLFVAVALVSILGFRGTKFTSPPMDVFPEWAFPGMKHQPKLRPQSASAFFADGRADRMPPEHTVMRGFEEKAGDDTFLRADDARFRGKDSSGQWVKGFPAAIKVDAKLMERGRDRYTIYCAPCHGALGDGVGITRSYGMGNAANYHDDRIRNMAEGEIFNTITNGTASKNMMPYADKLTPDDRWAVIAYVRALQRARMGTPADVTDSAARQSLGLK